MTGAVRAERRIAGSTGIFHGMASGAGFIKNRKVQTDPVGILMRFRLKTFADLQAGCELVGFRNRRHRVAQVAFQPDGGIFEVQMLTIMAAEAAG